MKLLGHQDDRAIAALAIPALGALAADPLYSLADTALVGNLGTPELGGVAVGTAAFTASFWLFSFLAYGVTPRVARAIGSGDRPTAARIGVQATLLAFVIGAFVTLIGVLFARPIVKALGAGPDVAPFAESYLRIRVLSAAAVLLAQVGHGWLRGAQNTRTPMIVAFIDHCGFSACCAYASVPRIESMQTAKTVRHTEIRLRIGPPDV